MFSLPLPITEQAFRALDETTARVELLDGSLLVSPRGAPRHQQVLGDLADLLAARHPEWHALTSVDVRLRKDRIVNPDLVLTGPVDLDAPVVDVGSVRLVAEVTSPGTECVDRVLKRHYFQEAGIPEYLIVDSMTGRVSRLSLDGDRYRESATTPDLVVPVP